MRPKRKIFKKKVESPAIALDIAAEITDFSKMQLKRMFTAGSVWIKNGKNENVLRKVKHELQAGDQLRIYHDPNIKEFDLETIQCIHDTHNWGIWYKPAGLVCQGTRYGDQYTLLRYVQKRLNKPPYLVHRLDRETSGLIIMAYHKKAARHFSELIKERKISKIYQVEVKGHLREPEGTLKNKIEDRDAISEYKVVKELEKTSLVEVKIITGRKHQIRIQFDEIGHAVMGDPVYGSDNKHPNGLRLVATKLTFREPSRRNEVTFELEAEKRLF